MERHSSFRDPMYIALRSRTFGFANSYNEAYKWVKDNMGNMQECLYDYLVLEYIEPGIHPTVHSEEWFQWNGVEGKWDMTERPAELKGIVNFALG